VIRELFDATVASEVFQCGEQWCQEPFSPGVRGLTLEFESIDKEGSGLTEISWNSKVGKYQEYVLDEKDVRSHQCVFVPEISPKQIRRSPMGPRAPVP
jgi:hypothetical protein